jgi:hypothetical protein
MLIYHSGVAVNINPKRSSLSSAEKYRTFRKAFDVIAFHKESGQFLAAFVIAFSVFEDRLRAAVILQADLAKTDRPIGHLPLHRQINRLERGGFLDEKLAAILRSAGDERNTLVHSAMWELEAVSEHHVVSAVTWARATDKLVSKLRRELKASLAKTADD